MTRAIPQVLFIPQDCNFGILLFIDNFKRAKNIFHNIISCLKYSFDFIYLKLNSKFLLQKLSLLLQSTYHLITPS